MNDRERSRIRSQSQTRVTRSRLHAHNRSADTSTRLASRMSEQQESTIHVANQQDYSTESHVDLSVGVTIEREEQLQTLLACTICLESFDDQNRQPKLLTCHHSFCMPCLVRLVSVTSSSNRFIAPVVLCCPICREITTFPSSVSPVEAIAQLQTNFYLSQMKDILAASENLTEGNFHGTCFMHGQKSFDFFCCTCHICICTECQDTDHQQVNGHIVRCREEVIVEEKELMKMVVTSGWRRVAENSNLTKRLEIEAACLLGAKKEAEQNINAEFEYCMKLVTERHHSLLQELEEEYNKKQNNISQILEDIRRSSSSLSCLINRCREVADNNRSSINDLVVHRTNLHSKCLSNESSATVEPIPSNFIKYRLCQNLEHVREMINSIGAISIDGGLPNYLELLECHAVACHLSTITFHMKNLLGEKLGFDKCKHLQIDILDSFNDVADCSLQQPSGQSDAVVFLSFWPKISGTHQLVVRFCGRLLPSITFTVLSNDPVNVIGAFQTPDGRDCMQYPRDIAIDAWDNVYVADSGNNRILKFNSAGVFLSTFDISSSNDEELSSCGIAVDSEHSVLVCTEVSLQGAELSDAHTILRFTLEGQLINRISYKDILSRALSVAVNSQGMVIIADLNGNAIFFFDASGRFVKKLGESGTGPSQFNHPNFLCIGMNDSIVVSDGENHRIQVFSKSGKCLQVFGEYGSNKGQLNMPFGVAVDNQNNIIVVDGGNRRVQIFDYCGRLIGCIESTGDPLSAPRGVTVTRNGHVLVVDRDNHCIKKYKYLR